MKSIFITGGASGLGLVKAQYFLEKGYRVCICGRRLEALEQAQKRFPKLETIQADISRYPDRVSLAAFLADQHPDLVGVIHNAGIQRDTDLTKALDEQVLTQEITTNLTALISLNGLLMAQLLRASSQPFIGIVTSGLSIVPLAHVPVYCATKAALHSFAISLRLQLNGSVKVVEIIPPMVKTDLQKDSARAAYVQQAGMEVTQYAKEFAAGWEAGLDEIYIGQTKLLFRMNRWLPKLILKKMNSR